MAIQMRRGNKADFDPSKMLPGEWAVAIDSDTQNQIVWMCFRAGVVKRMGTYEDFKEQIKEATAEIKNEYKEEFQTILGEIEKLAEQTSENRNTVVQIRDDTVNTYLPKMMEYVKRAESAATKTEVSQQQTAESATKAQSYAVGSTGSRVGEDTDNAKYYSEQAKAIYGEMQKEQVTGVKGDKETEYRYGNVNLTPENIGALPIGGGTLTGNLQVGEKVKLYTNEEGGNIQIISPDDIGLRWKLDAFKGDLRFICFNNDGTVKKICQLTRDGTIIANNATQSVAGLMSPKDKKKLDEIEEKYETCLVAGWYECSLKTLNFSKYITSGKTAMPCYYLPTSVLKGKADGTIVYIKIPYNDADGYCYYKCKILKSGNGYLIINTSGTYLGTNLQRALGSNYYGTGFNPYSAVADCYTYNEQPIVAVSGDGSVFKFPCYYHF